MCQRAELRSLFFLEFVEHEKPQSSAFVQSRDLERRLLPITIRCFIALAGKTLLPKDADSFPLLS